MNFDFAKKCLTNNLTFLLNNFPDMLWGRSFVYS